MFNPLHSSANQELIKKLSVTKVATKENMNGVTHPIPLPSNIA